MLPLVPVPAGQDLGSVGAVPVMSSFRQLKLIPRFLLTWAAATHWPRFLNPAQALSAGMPVSDWILSPIAGFFFKTSSILALWVEPLPLFALPPLPWSDRPAPWSVAAPIPVPPPAAPPLCPCCARAAVAYSATARLSIVIRVSFIRVCLHLRLFLLLVKK